MTGTLGAEAATDPRVEPFSRVLLATDLATASEEATDRAFELSARLAASLLVVSVIDPGQLRLPGGRFRARVDQVRAQHESAAQALVVRGQDAGVEVHLAPTTKPAQQ